MYYLESNHLYKYYSSLDEKYYDIHSLYSLKYYDILKVNRDTGTYEIPVGKSIHYPDNDVQIVKYHISYNTDLLSYNKCTNNIPENETYCYVRFSPHNIYPILNFNFTASYLWFSNPKIIKSYPILTYSGNNEYYRYTFKARDGHGYDYNLYFKDKNICYINTDRALDDQVAYARLNSYSAYKFMTYNLISNNLIDQLANGLVPYEFNLYNLKTNELVYEFAGMGLYELKKGDDSYIAYQYKNLPFRDKDDSLGFGDNNIPVNCLSKYAYGMGTWVDTAIYNSSYNGLYHPLYDKAIQVVPDIRKTRKIYVGGLKQTLNTFVIKGNSYFTASSTEDPVLFNNFSSFSLKGGGTGQSLPANRYDTITFKGSYLSFDSENTQINDQKQRYFNIYTGNFENDPNAMNKSINDTGNTWNKYYRGTYFIYEHIKIADTNMAFLFSK